MSKTISVDSLLEGDVDLHPSKDNEIQFVPLGELCISITRGITVTNEERIKFEPSDLTDIAYVGPGSFQGYRLDFWNTSFFSEYVESWDKGEVEAGDLLISKTITPPKAFVMDFPDEARVVASSNLFILKLDMTRIDPVYLMAYLNTDEGQEKLKHKAEGEKRTKAIPIDGIKKIIIPVPSLEEQCKIARSFSQKIRRVQQLSEELKNAEWALGGFYRTEESLDRKTPEYIFRIMER